MGWRFSGLPVRLRARSCRRRPATPRSRAWWPWSARASATRRSTPSMGHFVVMTSRRAIALVRAADRGVGDRRGADAGRARRPARLDGGERLRTRRRRGRRGGDRGGQARPLVPPRPRRPAGAPRAAGGARPRRRAAAEARPGRPAARLRHAQGARGDRRRGQPLALEGALRAEPLLPASRGSTGRRSACWPASRCTARACSTSRRWRSSPQFIDLCDTFNLPLVFLQDVPGLMVGSEAERGGILAGYERVVARLARATVPKVVVVVRKAYGGGHFALGGRPTHPDLILAWPTAELGFMAPETGVRTVYRRRLDEILATGGRGGPRPRSSPSCSPSGSTSRSRGRRRPSTCSSTTSSTRAPPARP